MLIVCKALSELKFGQLMEIYSESNQSNARLLYPAEDRNAALFHVEQEFYAYLADVFFPVKDATYFALEESDQYITALRMEPYKDGLLLEALETHPEHRRKGYAETLIRQALEYAMSSGYKCCYSHIAKENIASIKTHIACGFIKISDNAEYIDGAVTDNSFTYLYR